MIIILIKKPRPELTQKERKETPMTGQPSRQEILDKVIKILVKNGAKKKAEDISLIDNLNDDLDLDSLDVVEAVMDAEKEFNLSIPDEDAEKWSTVGDLVTYIESVV